MNRSRLATSVVILLGLIGVLIWWYWNGPHYRAVAMVKALDGQVITDADGLSEPVTSVTFWSRPLKDDDLACLKDLGPFQRLFLVNTPITDAGLGCLHNLNGLRWLCLDGTRVTDRGLASLSGLQQLELLSLNRTQITDAGLASLRSLSALRDLQLVSTRVSPKGVQAFKEARPEIKVTSEEVDD